MKQILSAVLLVWAAAQPAAARDQRERLLYNVMFGGLHVADVIVGLDQTPAAYDASLEMRSRGMLQWFQDFRADMRSQGAIDTAGLTPALYQRAWRAPEIASDMSMSFDPLPRAEERLFNPLTGDPLKPEDMPWNARRQPIPPVPDKLRAGAIDPISAFIAARRAFRDTQAREVRLPIYDGRRRYDIISTLGKPRTVTINDEPRVLTPVTSRLEPVFGFEDDGAEQMRKSRGTMMLTNDERFVPVQIIMGNDMFSSVMNLAADCSADPQACEAPAAAATAN